MVDDNYEICPDQIIIGVDDEGYIRTKNIK